eukprot:Rmarinus@m.21231
MTQSHLCERPQLFLASFDTHTKRHTYMEQLRRLERYESMIRKGDQNGAEKALEDNPRNDGGDDDDDAGGTQETASQLAPSPRPRPVSYRGRSNPNYLKELCLLYEPYFTIPECVLMEFNMSLRDKKADKFLNNPQQPAEVVSFMLHTYRAKVLDAELYIALDHILRQEQSKRYSHIVFPAFQMELFGQRPNLKSECNKKVLRRWIYPVVSDLQFSLGDTGDDPASTRHELNAAIELEAVFFRFLLQCIAILYDRMRT